MTSRRHFIGQSAAAASALAFPLVGGAQPKPVKVGVIHPVTGALAYSGQQCREGVMMAIEDVNKMGGIKSLGGAKIEALLGDAQSTPQAGASSVPLPQQFVWPPHKQPRSTTCPMWWMSAWLTKLLNVG
jgi:branched-chain amino acid transport system substrate-binding protein